MKLRLFTQPKCPKCPAAKAVADSVSKHRKDIEVEVLDITDPNNMTTALILQIVSTPSFTIDETPIFVGETPTFDSLNKRIDDYKTRSKFVSSQ